MIHRTDLSGTWDFVADRDPKYHLDTNIYPFPPYARPTENRRHWAKVTVPGVWQKYAERYDVFEGVGWYARTFVLDGEADSTPGTQAAPRVARLRCSGVNYACRVFVNGIEIGGHEGGYTEFVLDCGRFLVAGKNHIAIMVDNRATTLIWPPVLGYFNYGGIHRNVTLELVDGPTLDAVRMVAEPSRGGDGRLEVSGRVIGLPTASAGTAYRVELHVAGVTAAASVAPDGSFAITADVHDVVSWTPDHPALYDLDIELISDAPLDLLRRRIGFRSVAVNAGKVELNGEPLPLRGVCYVYDSPTNGLVMTDGEIRHDVSIMKEAGCNAVRCHYPMDEAFYAVCDEAGLLVWIEPPVYCYHPRSDETKTFFTDEHAIHSAETTIAEMISVARNHPSVVIYGIGNECNTEHPDAHPFFERLAAHVRRNDSTRLVSYAALYGNVGRIAELVDVLGVNSYWGWYDKVFGGKGMQPESDHDAPPVREPIDLEKMREMLDTILASRSSLALFLTEFGADSVPGYFSASRDLWSEDYHADLLREIFALASEYPQIVGTFPFCFSDYRDPSKTPNGYWNELNLKGMVDYHRNRKLAFDAIRSVYREPIS